MRILLVHQYFLEKDDPGGSRFNEMTKIWAEKNHEITVLAGMVNYNTGKKPKKYKGKILFKDNFGKNTTVIRCHVSETYNCSFSGRLWAYFSFVFSSIIASLIHVKGSYDVILVTSPPLFVGITGFVISLLKKAPIIFEVRDLWPESVIDTGSLKNKHIIKFAYAFEQFIYKKSRLINTLTPAFEKKLIEEKNVPDSKVIMIPNAADFSLSEKIIHTFDAQAFRSEHGFEDKLVIIYLGAHGIANHLIQVIDTAALIEPEPVLFLLIGDGMQKKDLVQEASRRNLSNIRFMDPKPKKEVFKYILAADIGTSVLKRTDTFKTIYSNKTFDYMSCKKPILMAIDGVSRELVETANCGLYVEPECPQDFADKINFYLQNKHSRQEHGINGYNYAKSNFDREVLANRYLQEIKNVTVKNEQCHAVPKKLQSCNAE